MSSMYYYVGQTNMPSVRDRLNGPDRTGGNILESAIWTHDMTFSELSIVFSGL